MRHYAIAFGLAFSLSVPLTLGVRAGARRWGFVAKPRSDRWHKAPTALHGGIAVFLAFAAALLSLRSDRLAGEMLLLVCSAAMFLLGLVDDLVLLKPYAKLVGQIIISASLTTFGMRLHWLSSPVLDQAVTMFWLVGITNALNLLDNLDGLAGGVAMIASLFLAHFCHAAGKEDAAAMCVAFAGAIAGFLVFNFNPASIFMGDSGSLFLGFFLGGVTMVNNQGEFQGGVRRNVFAVVGVPVLLLLIPIIDTTFVTLSRKLAGRPVSQGGRDHISHRLVAVGLSERAAALTLWCLASLAGGFAVLTRYLDLPVALLLVPVFGLPIVFFFVHLGRVKVYEPVRDEGDGHGRALFPTLADFAYKRRIFEVMSDLIVVVLAYYGAFLLRFDGHLVEPFHSQILASLPVVVGVQILAFLLAGLYRGLWRYTSMADLRILMRATAGSWVASVLALSFVFRLESFSRGVLIMDGVLVMIGVVGTRVGFRWLHTEISLVRGRAKAKRVLIYGAGEAGVILARELMTNLDRGLFPVGFIDDDPVKHGRTIHGVPVVGSLESVVTERKLDDVQELLVSTSKLEPKRAATLAKVAEDYGLKTRTMRIELD